MRNEEKEGKMVRFDERVLALQELETLYKTYRKAQHRYNLSRFSDCYLKHLATHQRPAFHSALMGALSSSTTQRPHTKETGSTEAGIYKEGEVSPSEVKSSEVEGGQTPTGGVDRNITIPPHFPTTFETSSNNKLGKRLLFIAPRGFAKSTICSVFYVLWCACYAHKKDILMVSSTISLSKELLRKVRMELELNPLILEDFGELKSDKWTEDMLILSNGVVIRAKGRGFQIRGFRPDLIVLDDLEDEEVIYSKEQRDKLENWFFRTLLPSLKPDQNLVYVGTKLHQFSLIAKLEVKPEFFVRKYQALTDGESIWPELWPTETLKKLRLEMGNYAFEAEYQNNPISLSDQPIKPHYLDGVTIAGTDILCLAIDPAISEKTSADERAFVLMSRSESGFREVYSEKGRWSIDEQIERIIAIWERFGMKPERDRVIIESVAFQKVFKDILLKEMRKRKLFVSITEAELGVGANKRPKDKMTRLLQVAHLFEQRVVEVRNPDLYQELTSFPHGDADNLVDACVYALYWLMKNRAGRSMKTRDEKKPLESKDSFLLEEVRPGVYQAVTEAKKPRFARHFINFNR